MSANRLINGKLDLVDDLKFLIDKVPLPSTLNGSADLPLGSMSAANGNDGKENGNENAADSPVPGTNSTALAESLYLSVFGSMEDVKKLVEAECMYLDFTIPRNFFLFKENHIF